MVNLEAFMDLGEQQDATKEKLELTSMKAQCAVLRKYMKLNANVKDKGKKTMLLQNCVLKKVATG